MAVAGGACRPQHNQPAAGVCRELERNRGLLQLTGRGNLASRTETLECCTGGNPGNEGYLQGSRAQPLLSLHRGRAGQQGSQEGSRCPSNPAAESPSAHRVSKVSSECSLKQEV